MLYSAISGVYCFRCSRKTEKTGGVNIFQPPPDLEFPDPQIHFLRFEHFPLGKSEQVAQECLHARATLAVE
jgi:hypothetical protein